MNTSEIMKKIKTSSIFEHPQKYFSSTIDTGRILSKQDSLKNPFKGASMKMQQAWKNMSRNVKQQHRQRLPDFDKDRVPDRYDCEPRNPKRQDSGRKIEVSQDGKSYIIHNPDGREIQVLQDYYQDFLDYAFDLGMSVGINLNRDTIQAHYGSNPSRILIRW